MKAGLYAVGHPKGFQVRATIAMEVDQWWWNSGLQTLEADKDVFIFIRITESLPLQWALALTGSSVEGRATHWNQSQWRSWLKQKLALKLKREQPTQIQRLLGFDVAERKQEPEWRKQVDIHAHRQTSGPKFGPQMRNAELLANLLSGRSLLRGELESLLGEQAHEIAADWPSILQLAYLQGWINLRPAVEHLDDGLMGAGTAPLSGWPARLVGLGQVRGRAAHVCTRCGSRAAGRPCAVCGSADCARCEACRTLGRSRSCELLVQGMPQERFSERGAAARLSEVQERLARWKLSPAQLAAAKEALSFLERERQPGGRTAADWSGGHQGGLGSWAAVRLMAAMAAPIQGGLRKLTASPVNSRDTSGWAAGDPSSRFLLWAVTGAGKTEMLFPLIESVRSRGGLVAVATPRRDVVLELAPRLRRAFPQEQIAVLYGGSEERWHRGGIILATTHQLLRFAQTFDLVVIDELDAFPFHGDPMLAYAAEAARAPDGRTVYLSATPPPALQRLVRRGRVACAKVPVRYHRHPLPVPELLRTPGAADVVRTGQIPPALLRRLRTSLARGAQVFIFVPKIALAEPLAALLRRVFKGVPVGSTSSRDEDRADKVLSFRSAELRMLVTTTILERGVTVPRSDVYVLDADSGLFDEASLVQMAGRAGRSADDPAGAVVFAANEKTAAQVGARRQIRRMNRLAAPYLLPGTGRSSRIRSLPIFRQPGAKPDASRPSPRGVAGISEAVPPPLSSVTRPLPANQPQDSAAVHDHARGRR